MAEQGTVKWFNGAKGYGFIAKMFCAFLGDRGGRVPEPAGGSGGAIRRDEGPQGQTGCKRTATLSGVVRKDDAPPIAFRRFV